MARRAEEVIAEFAPALARIAASYERDRALKEELLQEIVLAVVRALPRLKDADKLKPFVFRIAHNRAVSHVAARMREPPAATMSEGELPETLTSDAPDPEQTLLARERSAIIVEAVRKLPLAYRQVVTLLLEDMTYEEIAETLGLSLANVGVRVNRAKQQLKALIRHE